MILFKIGAAIKASVNIQSVLIIIDSFDLRRDLTGSTDERFLIMRGKFTAHCHFYHSSAARKIRVLHGFLWQHQIDLRLHLRQAVFQPQQSKCHFFVQSGHFAQSSVEDHGVVDKFKRIGNLSEKLIHKFADDDIFITFVLIQRKSCFDQIHHDRLGKHRPRTADERRDDHFFDRLGVESSAVLRHITKPVVVSEL